MDETWAPLYWRPACIAVYRESFESLTTALPLQFLGLDDFHRHILIVVGGVKSARSSPDDQSRERLIKREEEFFYPGSLILMGLIILLLLQPIFMSTEC